jgi:hypothetical protein
MSFSSRSARDDQALRKSNDVYRFMQRDFGCLAYTHTHTHTLIHGHLAWLSIYLALERGVRTTASSTKANLSAFSSELAGCRTQSTYDGPIFTSSSSFLLLYHIHLFTSTHKRFFFLLYPFHLSLLLYQTDNGSLAEVHDASLRREKITTLTTCPTLYICCLFSLICSPAGWRGHHDDRIMFSLPGPISLFPFPFSCSLLFLSCRYTTEGVHAPL